MTDFKEMNFDEFWAKLTELLRTKHDFSTTDQGKEFDARNAIDEISITPASSRGKRGIKKEEFRKIWFASKKLPSELVLKPGSYTNNTRHSSYIVTLMKIILESD
jgi:hypothetical protein